MTNKPSRTSLEKWEVHIDLEVSRVFVYITIVVKEYWLEQLIISKKPEIMNCVDSGYQQSNGMNIS